MWGRGLDPAEMEPLLAELLHFISYLSRIDHNLFVRGTEPERLTLARLGLSITHWDRPTE